MSSAQIQVASDLSDHSPPISGVQKKSQLHLPFPLKKQRKGLTIGGFHGPLIYETIIHNINTSFLQDGRYVPTKVIRVLNRDKPWFDDQCIMLLASSRRLIFCGHLIALGLTGKSLSAVK